MSKTRILLADDHTLFREGLRRLLEQEDDFQIVGEASDGEEAIGLVEELKPDVVLMDIIMPKLTGVEATKIIKTLNPSTHVLILTAYSDIHYILGLLKAGASGYLMKNARSTEIAQAIRAVKSGESVLDSLATQKLLENVVSQSKENLKEKVSHGHLSPREIEILRYVARDMSNHDIAEKLKLSTHTVKTHIANIFHKMRCSCRAEAIAKGFHEGHVTLEDVPKNFENVEYS